MPIYLVEIANAAITIYAETSRYEMADIPKGGRAVLRTVDGGKTWTNVSFDQPDLDTMSVSVSSDGKCLYVGASGAAYTICR